MIATNGSVKSQVYVSHWCPQKQRVFIPIAVLRKFKKDRPKFATCAWTKTPLGYIWSTSCCCPKDGPTKKMGRTIAIGRLKKQLAKFGWWLEEDDHAQPLAHWVEDVV